MRWAARSTGPSPGSRPRKPRCAWTRTTCRRRRRPRKGDYRPGFLAAIDACLKVRHSERPRSVAQLRPMLLGRDAAAEARASEPLASTRRATRAPAADPQGLRPPAAGRSRAVARHRRGTAGGPGRRLRRLRIHALAAGRARRAEAEIKRLSRAEARRRRRQTPLSGRPMSMPQRRAGRAAAQRQAELDAERRRRTRRQPPRSGRPTSMQSGGAGGGRGRTAPGRR